MVLALVFALVLNGKSGERTSSTTTTSVPPGNTPSTLAPSEFTEVRDPDTAFTIRYPRTWQRFEVPNAEVRLLVRVPNTQDSVSVKYFPTSVPTTPENLDNIRTVLDAEVFAQSEVQLQASGQITVNGLLAYQYVYTFRDQLTGEEGAHSHYFVFQGRKVYSIVFQTIPTTNFERLEPVFNQILESFRSDPEPATPVASTVPPAGPTPTPGPAATTVPPPTPTGPGG